VTAHSIHKIGQAARLVRPHVPSNPGHELCRFYTTNLTAIVTFLNSRVIS